VNRKLLAGTLIGATGLVGGYLKSVRPHVRDWGATPDEIRARLPGDDILPVVALQTTRAITIAAPSSEIWPWLVQMGPKPRAGVYTYDWIERMLGIEIENSDRILPEFQHLQPGETFELNKNTSLAVREVEPGGHLVLQWEPAKSTWAFCLRPAENGTTRLISRNRIPGRGPRFWLMMVGVMEWASLIMERKMLFGIKARAERGSAASAGVEMQPHDPVSNTASI